MCPCFHVQTVRTFLLSQTYPCNLVMFHYSFQRSSGSTLPRHEGVSSLTCWGYVTGWPIWRPLCPSPHCSLPQVLSRMGVSTTDSLLGPILVRLLWNLFSMRSHTWPPSLLSLQSSILARILLNQVKQNRPPVIADHAQYLNSFLSCHLWRISPWPAFNENPVGSASQNPLTAAVALGTGPSTDPPPSPHLLPGHKPQLFAACKIKPENYNKAHTSQNGHHYKIDKQQMLEKVWRKGNRLALLVGM